MKVQEANSKGGNQSGKVNPQGNGGNKFGKQENDTIKLNDMPETISEDDIRKVFGKYGNIRRIFHVQQKGFA